MGGPEGEVKECVVKAPALYAASRHVIFLETSPSPPTFSSSAIEQKGKPPSEQEAAASGDTKGGAGARAGPVHWWPGIRSEASGMVGGNEAGIWGWAIGSGGRMTPPGVKSDLDRWTPDIHTLTPLRTGDHPHTSQDAIRPVTARIKPRSPTVSLALWLRPGEGGDKTSNPLHSDASQPNQP
ncbi:uncharacterized protein LY79DRAFT_231423 [Colletotrichum navitas]|uniref:Uncharacterized protein n=1 Tax=Colletotrichum navitas TaxID=681940 RepID=A0AAD8PYI7_9PEZI|nr:uncharacterized protein LY79DRAFT_231423 [Colletotrichum navitas]KAK1589899.1 hypothetical protein LY79DRAFT_231423 [Colletotrichum navitas]